MSRIKNNDEALTAKVEISTHSAPMHNINSGRFRFRVCRLIFNDGCATIRTTFSRVDLKQMK